MIIGRFRTIFLYFLIATILGIFIAEMPLLAQNVTFQIKEKGTGLGLSKTEILSSGATIYSDPQGQAMIQLPQEDGGKVVFRRNGFETKEVLHSELRSFESYDIFLLPKTPEDEEIIVVTGKKKPQVSRKIVSIEESKKIAPGGDPAQVVKLLPGVQTGSGQNGPGNQIVVRGSGPRDSRYYIDDLEVPFIFHGIGDLSVIPAAMMQEVQFDAGGFGSEFGDATGGIIVIKTVSEIPERPLTEFVVNLPFYSGIFHTTPLSPDSSLTVATRRSYVEIFIKKFLESRDDASGESMTLVPYFGDAHVVYLKKDDTGHSKVSLIAAYDGIKAAVPFDSFADEDGRIKVDFNTAFINLGLERKGRVSSSWRYTSTPQLYYIKTNADFLGNALANRTQTLRAPTEFTMRLSKSEELALGVDPSLLWAATDLKAIIFRQDDPTFDPEDAEIQTVTNRETIKKIAAWASLDHQWSELLVTPGIRGSYNSKIDKFSLDPRLRLRQPIDDIHTLKASFGQYSQEPSPYQTSSDFGNPDLRYTRSMHYVLGLESKWLDAWTTELQVFFKTADAVVATDLEKRYNNQGSFRSKGAEVFVRRNLTARLFGWLSYTYSKTVKRDAESDPFIDSEFDQTHVLNIVGSYKLTAFWEIGSRFNHHTGDTYTPVSDSVYNANLDKYQRRLDESQYNSLRLPSANALTIYGTRQFLFDTWKMALKFGLESYWPEAQVVGVDYNYDYSREIPQKGLSAIPFIELNGAL